MRILTVTEITLLLKLWIYENHMCELRSEKIINIWRKIIAVKKQLMQLLKENLKKIQACTGFKHLTSAIPVQRSTNEANKPTGSRSLNWFVINPWKDNDEIVNIWISYMWTAEWRIIWRKIIAVIYTTYAVAKRKPEKKISGLYGIQILDFCETGAALYQLSHRDSPRSYL